MRNSVKRAASLILVILMGMACLTGCTPGDGRTAAQIGDLKLTYGEANFYVRYNQSMYESYYKAYGATDMASVWSGASEEDSEKTVGEAYLEELKTGIEDRYVIAQKASEYGVELSDAEKKVIEDCADEFIAANSEETREAMSATKENIVSFLTYQILESRVTEKMKEGVDENVTDEEALTKDISYVKISYATSTTGLGSAELDEVVGTFNEENKEVVKELAKEMADKYDGSDFKAYAESYGYTAESTTVNAASEYPTAEASKMAFELGENEVSEVYDNEDESCFYIFHMDNTFNKEATEQNKPSVVEQRRTDQYEAKLAEMKESMNIKWHNSVWSKISLEKVGVSMMIPDEVTQQQEQAKETQTLYTDPELEVEYSDKISLMYEGTIDGVAFEGGSTGDAATDLVIGSGTYIDDFEEQLIGSHPGDNVIVNVTFPDDYKNAELAGKEAQFDCTIVGIYRE